VKRLLCLLVVSLLCIAAAAQTAVVTRNVNLRPDASTNNDPIELLKPPAQVTLVESGQTAGFYHVTTPDGKTGFVWAKNVKIQSVAGLPTPGAAPGTASVSANIPSPRIAKDQPVDWWFVFKFNAASFPGCAGNAKPACPFGGTVQSFAASSQQYAFASSVSKVLHAGTGCAGDTVTDPVGATFDEIYNGTLNYVVWNDQFYQDPELCGGSDSCGAPWGHSKGVLAWNEDGDGVVMQVTTPDWPGSGNKNFPRKSEGNSLDCTQSDNDILVSQHFFSVKLTKDDVLKVLGALHNADVVTDPANQQIVKSGGPADIQALVSELGKHSGNTSVTVALLSTGIKLISKPSALHAPPWQVVSATLDGVDLRTATWWANPKIPTTTSSTTIACWDPSLGKPGAVEIATSGHFGGKTIGLKGTATTSGNHAKLGVSISGTHHYAIFGDMNQQGAISGNCKSSQNGRGGLFFVVDDAQLADSVKDLLTGDTAPTGP